MLTVDVAVSQDNMKRFHRNSSQKRARGEVVPIENINNLITSSENKSSSHYPSEFEDCKMLLVDHQLTNFLSVSLRTSELTR